MGITPAILAGGSVLGNIFGSAMAGNAQTGADQQGMNALTSMFNQGYGGLSPFIKEGQGALPELSNLLGLGPNGAQGMQNQLQSMPGYNFALQQGLRSVQNQMAARGLGNSGAAIKGAESYASGLASQNYQNLFQNVLGTAGLGANSAAQGMQGAMQAGQGLASLNVGVGNAQAGMWNGIGGSLSNAMQNPWLMSTMFGGGSNPMSMYGSPGNDLLTLGGSTNPMNYGE